MRRIIAIDPGTQCGYAYTDDGKVHVEQSGVWNLKPRRHEGGGMRFLRFRKHLHELFEDPFDKCLYSGELDWTPTVAVFYEEVRRHAGTDAAHIYGGLVGILSGLCDEMGGIAYQGIPVGTIKKRATGKGNANKEAMVNAANRHFLGYQMEEGEPPPMFIKDDNQADALWVLQCGIDELGA